MMCADVKCVVVKVMCDDGDDDDEWSGGWWVVVSLALLRTEGLLLLAPARWLLAREDSLPPLCDPWH